MNDTFFSSSLIDIILTIISIFLILIVAILKHTFLIYDILTKGEEAFTNPELETFQFNKHFNKFLNNQLNSPILVMTILICLSSINLISFSLVALLILQNYIEAISIRNQMYKLSFLLQITIGANFLMILYYTSIKFIW